MSKRLNAHDIDVEMESLAPARNKTRRGKIASGTVAKPTVKEYAASDKGIKEFAPTPSQKQFINKIRENVITFVDSEAGTGKSSAVLWHYCKEYLLDKSKNIYIIRTPVEAGSDKVGFLPNSLQEKCAPHFASSKVLLEQFLGKGRVEDDMEKRIFFKIPNFCLGATWNNCLILIDEVQQIQPIILKLLLERIGDNTKVVVAGCSSQLYVKEKDRNALADAISRFFVKEDGEYVAKYADMGYHEFDLEECHRADVVKDIIRGYKGL